jgi:uncharacterized protein
MEIAGTRVARVTRPGDGNTSAAPRLERDNVPREKDMAASSAGFHESEEVLSEATRDLHRAIVSLMEELEAIDWYQQRMEAARDGELRDILRHNRDEEMEHAAMLLEWIRRRSPDFDGALRPRLFVEGPVVAREEALEGDVPSGGRGAREASDAGEHGGSARGNGREARGRRAATSPRVTVGSLRETR